MEVLGGIMSITHYNTAFEGMTKEQIEKWIDLKKERFVGSAVFTSNKSTISKLVRWAENRGKEKHSFVPSHVGSVVMQDGKVYIFDMKPPKATKTLLSEYIYNTKDEFVIVLRDFMLDTQMFSANILEYEGRLYPYLSAIRSICKLIPSKWARHCSELHLRELQKQGLFTELNPEITPLELYLAMCK